MYGDDGDEQAKDIELTSAGELVIVGDRILNGEMDFVIYRLSASDGALIGTPTIGGKPGVADHASSITEISDGFLVASYEDNGTFKTGNVYRYYANMDLYPNTWGVEVAQLAQVGGYDVVPIRSVQVGTDLFYTFGYSNTTLLGDGTPDYNMIVYVSNGFNDRLNFFVIPGPDANSNERLTSARAVPVQSGGGFVLAGYVAKPSENTQDLYLLQLRQDLKEIDPSDPDSYLVRSPKSVTTQLSSVDNATNASVYPSKTEGFILLGDQNSLGNNDIYLTKVDNSLANAWPDPHTFFSLGGDGNDLPGAVTETSDGRILLCGTMVLGNAIGQKKIVLINVNPFGMFDE
jgi:hypothetical protein